jgi:hypothetical protein
MVRWLALAGPLAYSLTSGGARVNLIDGVRGNVVSVGDEQRVVSRRGSG